MSTALAPTAPLSAPIQSAPSQRLALALPAEELKRIIEERKQLGALIDDYLEEGTDYGTIPGTEKKTLLKPGSEKVCNAYNVYAKHEILEREIDHDREVKWTIRYKARGNRAASEQSGVSYGLYRYVVRSLLIHRPSGLIVGEGVGAASTMESRYVRNPRDQENTVLKIAKKRADVDATLTAFNLSERFTQDVEDLPPQEVDGENGEQGEEVAPPPIGFPYPGVHQGKPLNTKKEDGSGYLFSAETLEETIGFAEKKLSDKKERPKNPEFLRRYIVEARAELQRRADEAVDGPEGEKRADPTSSDASGDGSPNSTPSSSSTSPDGLSTKPARTMSPTSSEGEQRPDPTPAPSSDSSTSAGAASPSASSVEATPHKGDPAPTSAYAYGKRVKALIDDERLPDDQRDYYKQRFLHAGMSVEKLARLEADLRHRLGFPQEGAQ
jgi:hypothetical protein